ncbi:hypothetical protein B0H67DRAFT_648537 [Lasiosphaeris hirsuta]|uniref:Uncharacterized protein n=1 Tax=Lasiosphaeris hirsuta TaxID=260670 RepID=A0AA40A3F4_9PEZI|nr:hypothetical protein B0H67DRAFT_648537 [Lasiosphaeris hirsuta]
MEERQEEARAYLDPSDQNKPIGDLAPSAKHYCFLFLVTTLGNEHMGPVEKGLDFWFDFGFVTCPGRTAESNLGLAYHKLFTGNKKSGEATTQASGRDITGPATARHVHLTTFGKPGRRAA